MVTNRDYYEDEIELKKISFRNSFNFLEELKIETNNGRGKGKTDNVEQTYSLNQTSY